MNGYRIIFSELTKLANTPGIFTFVGSSRPIVKYPHYMSLTDIWFHIEVSLTKNGVSGGSACGRGMTSREYRNSVYGQFL